MRPRPPVRLPNRDREVIPGNARFRHSVFPIPAQRVRAGPAIKERDFMRRFGSASFGLALAAAALALGTAPASAIPAQAPAAPAVSSGAVMASERCTIWRRRCRDLHPAHGWGFRRCMSCTAAGKLTATASASRGGGGSRANAILVCGGLAAPAPHFPWLPRFGPACASLSRAGAGSPFALAGGTSA